MSPRTGTSPVLPARNPTLTLADGRVLTAGQEFSVKGEGRFRFAYQFSPDGSVTAWGPVGAQSAQWRSFHRVRIGTIHRSITPRGGKGAESRQPTTSPVGDDEE